MTNAGITRFVSVEDMTEAGYDEVSAVNARDACFTAQKLVPLLEGGGVVVMTTSVAASKGLAASSAYAVSKAAVRSMTRRFARKLLPRGVRADAVSPGPINTGVLERALPWRRPGRQDAADRHQPLGSPREAGEGLSDSRPGCVGVLRTAVQRALVRRASRSRAARQLGQDAA